MRNITLLNQPTEPQPTDQESVAWAACVMVAYRGGEIGSGRIGAIALVGERTVDEAMDSIVREVDKRYPATEYGDIEVILSWQSFEVQTSLGIGRVAKRAIGSKAQ